jgi:hypothetical protein
MRTKPNIRTRLQARLGIGDTRIPWSPDGTPGGHVGPRSGGHTQIWTYICAGLSGALGLAFLIGAIHEWQLYKDYSNVFVQAVTGRDGTWYGLLAVVFLACTAVLFYTAQWLARDKGNWHKP